MAATRRKSKSDVLSKTLQKNTKKCKKKAATKVNVKGNFVKCAVVTKITRKKRKRQSLYSQDAVKNALKEIESGVSFRIVSRKYAIPISTLSRKRQQPNQINVTRGPPPILTEIVEKDIADWIIHRAAIGHPVTKDILLDSVKNYLDNLKLSTPFTNNRPSRHWYEGFLRRHPDITLRTAQYLTRNRAEVTEDVLREWFREIQVYLEGKRLLDIDGSRIFNCDETSISLAPKPHKVLTMTGASNVYKHSDVSEKENLTVLMMYSASGERAPPMILYKYAKKVPKRIVDVCPSDWGIGISESGWMTTECFYEYFTNVFYPWLIKQKIEFPITVYMDGHGSHVTIPLVKFCREKKIEIISLHPNSTHITQPLDVSFFHPLKERWRKVSASWKNDNNEDRITKEIFPKLLEMTLNSFEGEKKAIVNGFRKAGLYPFNPNNVDYKYLEKKSATKRNFTEETISVSPLETSIHLEQPNIHLRTFEKNLPPNLLQQFTDCESSKTWNGSVENAGLFNYWLQLKDHSAGNTIKKPRITSDRMLSSQERIVFKEYGHNQREVDENICNKPTNEEPTAEIENIDTKLTDNEDMPWLTEQEPINEEYTDDIENIDAKLTDNVDKPWLNGQIYISQAEFDAMMEESALLNVDDQHNDIPVYDLVDPQHKNLPVFDLNDTQCTDISIHNSTNLQQNNLPMLDVTNSLLQNVASDSHAELHGSNVSQHSTTTETKVCLMSDKQMDSTIKICNAENEQPIVNRDITDASVREKSFANAFTLPEEYLPKNKKSRLRNKKKTPSVGTSDDWLKLNQEKEEDDEKKRKKVEERKKLQDYKKELADKKKKVEAEIKEVQSKIRNTAVKKIKKEKLH